jgi:hypothetical protein
MNMEMTYPQPHAELRTLQQFEAASANRAVKVNA